ncbi:LOW QUALITY PROTEIN: Hypothetical protein PHPALM_14602 [Phytophthora palmivora]|uniref:RNase H type-1 domain-containing protein n=1 Tax=Phytophthora palmivora TaxID=4796 RepID=A0A2P4XU89_9STRA|nr:LOW QUALITY PROTEIN: Hypothetical protein PHPALM_14602 [Phytophthora palmivora]
MEAQGLLACLRWIQSTIPTGTAYVFGNSRVITNQYLMVYGCRAPGLQPRIAAIRAQSVDGPFFYLQHVRREYNIAVDVLCNWIMDSNPPGVDRFFNGGDWSCPTSYGSALSPSVMLPFSLPHTSSGPAIRARLMASWSLVLQDFADVAHLIRCFFVPSTVDGPRHPPVRLPRPPERVSTASCSRQSQFDAPEMRSCHVLGIARCVPKDVFNGLRVAAALVGVDFPLSTAFLAARPGSMTIPHVDLRILDALITDARLGIAGTLAIFRDPTRLSSQQGASVDVPPALAHVRHRGRWAGAPLDRTHPVPTNYPGATAGSTIVISKLLAHYNMGRCIIASMDTLVRDLTFHSSVFALKPKDKPIHSDGRIIHDLSAPDGDSVNALTNSAASPDATWDSFVVIANRVRELHCCFPGNHIHATIADIANAFHHVPVHARQASAFGGHLPRSSHGIVQVWLSLDGHLHQGFLPCSGKWSATIRALGLLGHVDPFWTFQLVDDIVLIEVDIDDRLQQVEKRLRDGIKFVFGSQGLNENKFTTRSSVFYAVSIDWSIQDEMITIPQRKITKPRKTLDDTMGKSFISLTRLDSLIGVLRHVISFIPINKIFIQRLTAVQKSCRKYQKVGTPMTQFLRKDLGWWNNLVFQGEFAGMPMRLFYRNPKFDDAWLITSVKRRFILTNGSQVPDDSAFAKTLARVTNTWGPA